MCRRSEAKKDIITVIQALKSMDADHRLIFETRYAALLRSYRRRCLLYASVFHVGRTIVTVGSISVPALLSLSATDFNWLIWTISLSVSIANGILTLFKIDKKYYSLHTTRHALESEGWQYVALTGKYGKPHGTDHKCQFTNFTLTVEKIRMNQVHDEYYKSVDADKHTAGHSQQLIPTASSPVKEGEKSWQMRVIDDSEEMANTIEQGSTLQNRNNK
jgi:hypothetical protein